MHRTLEQVLRTLISDVDKPWSELLPIAEFFMNSAISSSTGKSPHEIVFGKPPIDPHSTILASQVPQHAPGVQTFAEARQQLRAQVKEAIEKAKGKYTI